MSLRKRVWRLENRLTGEISGIMKRLEVLECRHDYMPTIINRYSWIGDLLGQSPVIKCSKCGHVLREITEEEFHTTRMDDAKSALAKLKKEK